MRIICIIRIENKNQVLMSLLEFGEQFGNDYQDVKRTNSRTIRAYNQVFRFSSVVLSLYFLGLPNNTLLVIVKKSDII